MSSQVWQTFLAIAWKELVQLRRHAGALWGVLFLQLIEIGAVAWIDTTVKDLPLVVVDQDHTAASRELIARIAATKTFTVKYQTSSTEQARSHIRAGRAKAALVIPPDYGRLSTQGAASQILALVDGSDSVAAEQVTASIDGVAVQMNVESLRDGPPGRLGNVEASRVLLFNPSARVPLFMLPGLLPLILLTYYCIRGTSLAEEREGGHLERLLMTPMSYTGLFLGKLVPYFIAALINAAIFLLVIRWICQVPIHGSLGLLWLGLVLYTLTFLSVAAVVAAGAQTAFDAMITIVMLFLPAEMLTGYIFPLSALPKWLLPVSYALPETHIIEIMRGICLRGSWFVDLAPHFAFLVLAPIVLLSIARTRFERSIMQR